MSNKHGKLSEEFTELKSKTINSIQTIIKEDDANSVFPATGIILQEVNEEEGEIITEVFADGKVTYSNGECVTNLHDLSLDLLLVLLKELELGKYYANLQ